MSISVSFKFYLFYILIYIISPILDGTRFTTFLATVSFHYRLLCRDFWAAPKERHCSDTTHEIFPSRGTSRWERGDPTLLSWEGCTARPWARYPARLGAQCPGYEPDVKGHGDPLISDRDQWQSLVKANPLGFPMELRSGSSQGSWYSKHLPRVSKNKLLNFFLWQI